ncbi:MAG: hypothetical protein ACD_71C00121G0001 [uncultured bacterium (gcode 4)]|uniref:Uncharacterized protein n=1 Tax=uncultured bacterium (gcode 4) TaxID=1234023 RepID=K1Z4M0_9BACT|nr:MAG: hypothetical protein ACD_71C00121G0001 [uncultured bacterium (gcode 4)]
MAFLSDIVTVFELTCSLPPTIVSSKYKGVNENASKISRVFVESYIKVSEDLQLSL